MFRKLLGTLSETRSQRVGGERDTGKQSNPTGGIPPFWKNINQEQNVNNPPYVPCKSGATGMNSQQGRDIGDVRLGSPFEVFFFLMDLIWNFSFFSLLFLLPQDEPGAELSKEVPGVIPMD